MSLTTNSEATTLNISFKYVWNVDQEILEKLRRKESVTLPLFGPDNFENIKFQLEFCYSRAAKYPLRVGLKLISSKVSPLKMKYKMILKTNSMEKPHEIKTRGNFVNIRFGAQLLLPLRDFMSVEYMIYEIELILPENLQTPLIKLISDFNSLRTKSRFTDVTFVLGTKEFPAHKDILSARSPVFAVMFSREEFIENQQNRVDITDIDEKVFGALLDFIYTAQVKQLDEIAPELLVAAHKYDIKSLFDECVKSMLESMNKENVVHYLVHAKMYSLTELQDKAIDLINRNAQELTNREDFVKHVKPDLLLMHELYLDFVKKYPQI